METLNLVKGQKVDLNKGNEGLATVVVGLGWDINQGNSGSFDLDAFAIPLHDGKYTGAHKPVFFGNLTGPGIKHNGDNLTGEGAGDDEQIEITLASIPADVDQVILAVNIYQAASKHQNFGMVQNAFIRIVDKATNTELMRYDLSEDYGSFTGVVFARLYRHDGFWKTEAIGQGKNGDINEIAATFA